jgi:hypothetical protein
MTNLCHPKRTLPAGGEHVCAFTGKYAPKHQIIYLELSTLHKLLVIAPERLVVPCILESCLPSLFVDEIDIITPEPVLHDFVVCLDTGGDHGDFWEDNSFDPIHQKERRLPHGPA